MCSLPRPPHPEGRARQSSVEMPIVLILEFKCRVKFLGGTGPVPRVSCRNAERTVYPGVVLP